MATENPDFSELVNIKVENKDDPQPSNTEKPEVARSAVSFSEQAFRELHDSIRSRSKKHISYKEPDVYRQLMDDLEDEEDPPRWCMKLFAALEMVVILGVTAALVATLKVEGTRHQRLILVMRVMLPIFGLSAVRFVTFLVLAPVKWWWRTHKYVVYFVKEIKLCVDVTLWFALGLVDWYLWFKPRLRNVNVKGDESNILAYHITRLLIALVVGSFLWLLKNLLYLKLKADLLYDQLFPKIQRTVLDFHCLQMIYSYGMWRFLNSEKNKRKVAMEMKTKKQTQSKEGEDGKEGHVKGKNIWMNVAMMKKQTVPIWITRQLAHNYLKKIFRLPSYWEATKDDQNLLKEAQQLLRGVIIGGEERSDILPDDLRKYELDEDEQEFLFRIFYEGVEEKWKEERERPKTITKNQFLSWAVVAYKNCWGLRRTLLGSRTVFINLNRILNTFLLTVVLIIWLLTSKIIHIAQLAILLTPFLAATFIFGDSSKKMFEGIIFAFIIHPFDVGDRVLVDNVRMKVSQMNILTTEFLIKYDTGEEEAVQFPNSLLANKDIVNLDIIPDQAPDCLEFNIPSSTPFEDITDLELKIMKALDDDLTYSSQTKVVKKEIGKEEIKMAVYFKYLVSETKAMHRSSILTKIMEFTKEMDSNIKRELSNMDDDHQVVPVEFTLHPKVEQRQIDDLKGKILEAYKEQYIKLVVKDLDKKKIVMVLYLRRPKCSSGDSMDSEKQRVHAEIQTLKEQLKIRCGAWSSIILSEVRSLGRASENEDP